MRQSHLMSFVEVIANVSVGFLIAILTQIAVFSIFRLHVTVGDTF